MNEEITKIYYKNADERSKEEEIKLIESLPEHLTDKITVYRDLTLKDLKSIHNYKDDDGIRRLLSYVAENEIAKGI